MRIRTLATAFVVSAVATLPLAGVAAASDGDTCPPPPPAAPAAPATSEDTTVDSDDSDETDDSEESEDSDEDSDEDSSDDEATPDEGEAEATPDEGEAATVEAEVTCTQVAVVPVGGVETGDGSATSDPTPALVVILGASALGVGAVVRRAARQSG